MTRDGASREGDSEVASDSALQASIPDLPCNALDFSETEELRLPPNRIEKLVCKCGTSEAQREICIAKTFGRCEIAINVVFATKQHKNKHKLGEALHHILLFSKQLHFY